MAKSTSAKVFRLASMSSLRQPAVLRAFWIESRDFPALSAS